MIIAVKRDKGVITLPQTYAAAVPEFETLINECGVEYMAYVVYVTDPGEANIYAGLPKAIRQKTVAEDLKLEPKKVRSDAMKAALKKYQLFVNENWVYKLMDTYNEGMDKINTYLSGIKKVDGDNVDDLLSNLSKIPDMIKNRQELAKAASKEEAKRGRVKGERQLTLAEKQYG